MSKKGSDRSSSTSQVNPISSFWELRWTRNLESERLLMTAKTSSTYLSHMRGAKDEDESALVSK